MAGRLDGTLERKLMNSRIGYLAALAVFVPLASATAAEKPHFAPHRAVYDFTLTNAATGAGVADLDGRMVYELTGSECDGYTQHMRFVTRMTNQEGEETITDLRNQIWEDPAEKEVRFSSSQYSDDKLVDSSQGEAKRPSADARITVDLTKPKQSKINLPADTLFPMQHAMSLITAAKAGQKFVTAKIFDGSEKGDKVYLTSAVIGKAAPPGASRNLASLKGSERLAALQSWPLSISYFETGNDNRDVAPTYELSYRFYENGVTSELAIDYGEFAIEGTLKEITFLPEPACNVH